MKPSVSVCMKLTSAFSSYFETSDPVMGFFCTVVK